MFTDPVAQVVFVNPATGEKVIWAAPEMPFVTGVTLVYEMERKSSIQINIEAPYADAINKILCAGTPLAIGNNVKVRIGYASQSKARPAQWTPWFGGFLNAGGDGLTLDPNGLSGTITVQAIPTIADYIVSSETVVSNTDPQAMLEGIIQSMGLVPYISPNAVDVLKRLTTFSVDAESFYPAWNPQPYVGMSMLEGLKSICKMANLRYSVGPHPDPGNGSPAVCVGTEAEAMKGVLQRPIPDTGHGKGGNPVATFVMRGAVDIETMSFPCLSWGPEGGDSATWLSAGDDPSGKGVLIAYIDTDTGEIKEVTATPETSDVPTAGVQAAVQQDNKLANPDGTQDVGDAVKADGNPPTVMGAPMPPGEGGEFRAQLSANRQQQIGNPAQQGDMTSLGLPWITPNALVRLRGCGAMYDDVYEVRKATHTWTKGGYDMTLGLFRRGSGGTPPVGKQVQTEGGEMAPVHDALFFTPATF